MTQVTENQGVSNRERFLNGESFYLPQASYGDSTFRLHLDEDGEPQGIYEACMILRSYIGNVSTVGSKKVSFFNFFLKRKLVGSFRFEDMQFVPINEYGKVIKEPNKGYVVIEDEDESHSPKFMQKNQY